MNISLTSLNSWIRRLGRPPMQVPDVNLIPRDYARGRRLSRNNALVLLIVLELMIAILLFRTYGDAATDKAKGYLGQEEAPNLVQQNEQRLQTQVGQKRAQLASLKDVGGAIKAKRTDWPQLLDLFFNQTPATVSVATFRPDGDLFTLTGQAEQPNDVISTYKATLLESPFVSQVTIPSIGAAAGDSDKVDFTIRVTLQRGVTVE